MSRKFPDLSDVVALLTSSGYQAHALRVRRAIDQIEGLERSNEQILAAYQNLQRKHEPQPKGVDGPVWTGD